MKKTTVAKKTNAVKKTPAQRPTRKKSTKTRKPRQKRAHETVELILDATIDLINQDGYKNLTTNKIAEHAGISIGSLYQYFPNRLFIIHRVYELAITRVAEKLRSNITNMLSEDIKTAVPELMKGLLTLYRTDETVLIHLVEEVPDLRNASKNLPLEILIQGVNRIYFTKHQTETDLQSIEQNLFFATTIILENLRKYLLEKPSYLSDEEFVKKLSTLIIFLLESL